MQLPSGPCRMMDSCRRETSDYPERFRRHRSRRHPFACEVAQQTGRIIADLDAFCQVLEGAGYVTRFMTLASPSARSRLLQDSAHIWNAEQNPYGLSKVMNVLMEVLREVQMAHSSRTELANRLRLHLLLVQELLLGFRLEAGYVKPLTKTQEDHFTSYRQSDRVEQPRRVMLEAVPSVGPLRADTSRVRSHTRAGSDCPSFCSYAVEVRDCSATLNQPNARCFTAAASVM